MINPTEKIVGAFKEGFAKANRYRVILPSTFSEQLDIMCDQVNWPGRQLTTTESFTDLKASRRVYAFIPDDVSISFLLSNNWFSWDYLNTWQKQAIGFLDREDGYVVNFRNDYSKDIEIYHLDEQDNIKRKVKLFKAFPTTLTSIDLGNQNENTVIRVTATFAYDNWATIT